MTRYSLINKTDTHACMEPSAAGDWVLFDDVQRLLKTMDDLPDDWDKYSAHWKAGYSQCRNKLYHRLKIT